jgi:hypothetical protein
MGFLILFMWICVNLRPFEKMVGGIQFLYVRGAPIAVKIFQIQGLAL